MQKTLFVQHFDTPIGEMASIADDTALLFLNFSDTLTLEEEKKMLRSRYDATFIEKETPINAQLKTELQEYFDGTRLSFSVPIRMIGTEFQQNVWTALKSIPYGRTACYQELGRILGDRSYERAVGNANGKNKFVILIPCHRVIQKSGHIGGYSAGVARKEFLLDLEKKVAQQIVHASPCA